MMFGIGQSELPWGIGGTAAPADVARVCQEIKALGANSIRMSALWLQLDPNRNHKYQWANLDIAVDAAEDAGLDILLIVEPRRSVLPIGVSATLTMATDYGLLCGAIASRYEGRIRWYEIGNEVNNLAFFGSPKTPSKYLNFLRAAFTNITAADGDATVLAGALQAVGTGWPTLHPVEWVTAFYDCNPQDWFHGLSMHPYSTDGVFHPLAPTPDNEFAFKNIDAIRAIMDANGDSAKKIFCTEWGYDSMRTLDGSSTTDMELEAEQARNLSTHWNILKTYADAGAIYETTWIFMYRDWEQANKKAQNHFGITHFDYTKKAAWEFVRSLARPTEVAPPTAAVTTQAWNPTVEVFVDPTNKKPNSAGITVQAWNPTFKGPLYIPSAPVTVQAWNPTVEILSDAQYVSKGVGHRDTSGDDDVSFTVTHDVTNGNMLLVGIGISTSNGKPWEYYDPFTVTSDLDGAFTRYASTHVGSSSVKKGSVHCFKLRNPTIGSHTITVHVANSVSSFTSVAANSFLFSGVSALGAVASNTNGSGTPHVTIASTVGNQVFFIGCAATPFNDFNQPTKYSVGSTIDGDGDYTLVSVADGAPSVEFTTSLELTKYGVIAVDLKSY